MVCDLNVVRNSASKLAAPTYIEVNRGGHSAASFLSSSGHLPALVNKHRENAAWFKGGAEYHHVERNWWHSLDFMPIYPPTMSESREYEAITGVTTTR
jgi:hypothetical protein